LPAKYYKKGVINMDMIKISPQAVQDIKDILKERKMDTMYLRINASVG
jgi:Fe-S cluster assembly iron-binding protein IscA